MRSHLQHFQPDGGIFTPLSICFKPSASFDTYIHTYIHTCIHTHAHTHTHTHTLHAQGGRGEKGDGKGERGREREGRGEKREEGRDEERECLNDHSFISFPCYNSISCRRSLCC